MGFGDFKMVDSAYKPKATATTTTTKKKTTPTYTAPKVTAPTNLTTLRTQTVSTAPTVVGNNSSAGIGKGMQNTGGSNDSADTSANDYCSDILAQRQRAAEIRTQAALDANNAYIPQINQQSDQRLQSAYISKEQNRVNLPQQLSALGYSGGATETSLMGAQTGYENSRNSIEQDRGDALSNIYQNAANIQATGNADLADNSATYYQNLVTKAQQDASYARQDAANAQSQSNWLTEYNADQAQTDYENKLALAQYKAELGDYSGLQALGINTSSLTSYNGSTPTTKAKTYSAGNSTASTSQTNYYNEADRLLAQRTIPSSQTALIKQYNMEGKLSDVQAQALLKKYGLTW